MDLSCRSKVRLCSNIANDGHVEMVLLTLNAHSVSRDLPLSGVLANCSCTGELFVNRSQFDGSPELYRRWSENSLLVNFHREFTESSVCYFRKLLYTVGSFIQCRVYSVDYSMFEFRSWNQTQTAECSKCIAAHLRSQARYVVSCEVSFQVRSAVGFNVSFDMSSDV